MIHIRKATLLWLASATLCAAQMPVERVLPATPEYTAARGPSLALALEAAQAAIAACKAMGSNVAVTVVDSAGVVKVTLTSDGAFAKAVVTSAAKAVTAKDLNMPISEIFHQMKTDTELAGKIGANPKYVVGQGGLPLRVGNEVLGAIGVGGSLGSREQDEAWPIVRGKDEQCAQAGVDRIRARLGAE